MIRIDKVGLEFELNLHGQTFADFVFKNRIPVGSFENIKIAPTDIPIKMRVLREYYNNQIEFNIPFQSVKTIAKKIYKFSKNLKNRIKNGEMRLEDNGPSFVGTHIHFWLSNTNPLSECKDKILYHVLKYIYNYFEKININLINDIEYNDIILTLNRLFYNHTIWINFDYKNKYQLSKNHIIDGLSWAYTNNKKNKKYNPIIWSKNINNVKPNTLELRLIPNYFIQYDYKKIIEIIDIVEKTINSKKENIDYIKEIISLHRDIGFLKNKINSQRISDYKMYEYLIKSVKNKIKHDIYMKYKKRKILYMNGHILEIMSLEKIYDLEIKKQNDNNLINNNVNDVQTTGIIKSINSITINDNQTF